VILPLLAASDYGLVIAVAVLFVMFFAVGWVIMQGTRAQMAWRRAVDAGDVPTIQMLVGEELLRWKTIRMPKGTRPSVWHGVQSAELVDVQSDGVRITASADGQYGMVDGERREISGPLVEGMRVTAKLADMVLYDIPNARLPYVQIDIYSTYRDDVSSSQRCILSTKCQREVADVLAWEEMDAEEVVQAFGGRFLLDDRGNPLAVNPESTTASGVPAVFYKDD
jgi:hypothetical protein